MTLRNITMDIIYCYKNESNTVKLVDDDDKSSIHSWLITIDKRWLIISNYMGKRLKVEEKKMVFNGRKMSAKFHGMIIVATSNCSTQQRQSITSSISVGFRHNWYEFSVASWVYMFLSKFISKYQLQTYHSTIRIPCHFASRSRSHALKM